MLTNGYFITAELQVKDLSRLMETKDALKILCEETLKEPGCNMFTLHQCQQMEGRFLLWERFEDEAAFQQHFVEQHTQDFVDQNLTEIVQFFQTDIVTI